MRQSSLTATAVLLLVTLASAQSIPAARLAILAAEERGAPDARDLTAIRSGLRSSDEETVRVAVRALGRLRRPALVGEILPLLKSRIPEVRAEAAVATAQALGGTAPVSAASRTSALNALMARLDIEAEASVRGAICDAIGRLPGLDGRQIGLAEQALVKLAQSDFLDDRLGVARGLEGLVRRGDPPRTPAPPTIDALRNLAGVASGWSPDDAPDHQGARAIVPDALRDARVRRLALDALTTVHAIDASVVTRAAHDADPQMRWRAVQVSAQTPSTLGAVGHDVLLNAVDDSAPLVRAAAVSGLNALEPGSARTCARALSATRDANVMVVLAAIDVLASCGSFQESLALTAIAMDERATRVPRSWQVAAHAVLALARSAPTMASPSVTQLAGVPIPGFRYYVALAAAATHDTRTLERLSHDSDPRVAAAARGAAGVSLGGDLVGRDVASLPSNVSASGAELVRLAASRVRVTIRDLGAFELALLTSEAPRTVLRFTQLVQAGAFDGMPLTASSATQVGFVPAATPTMSDMKPELGRWPHVRGVAALATEPEGLNGARIVINLVDNPRLDGACTAFAQILSGADVLDSVLEGDVIEKVEILAGS